MFWIVVVSIIQGSTERPCLPKHLEVFGALFLFLWEMDMTGLENGKTNNFGKEMNDARISTENQMKEGQRQSFGLVCYCSSGHVCLAVITQAVELAGWFLYRSLVFVQGYEKCRICCNDGYT